MSVTDKAQGDVYSTRILTVRRCVTLVKCILAALRGTVFLIPMILLNGKSLDSKPCILAIVTVTT